MFGAVVTLVEAVPRRPPNYQHDSMPDTSFTCDGKVVGGYYADPDADCQMFHICVQVNETDVSMPLFPLPIYDIARILRIASENLAGDAGAVRVKKNGWKVWEIGKRIRKRMGKRKKERQRRGDGLTYLFRIIYNRERWS